MRKLKLFLASLAMIIGGGNANAYQTPTANGIYYLYNTACTDGTPGFMSSGNNYGFQVVIDNFGFPVKLVSTGTENTYKFQFIHHNGWLSDDGFMYSDGDETNRARTITVQDQGNGTYKLLNTNNSKEIEDWYGDVVGDGTGNRHNYLWQFFSKDERNAMIAGYTKDQKLAAATSMGISLSEQTSAAFDEYIAANYIGIDQSSKIQNGTFDTSHNTTGWTTSANSNRSFTIGWGNVNPKTTPEVYEGAGAITQTVTVDKAGLYKVSVNATYRCGNNENNNRIGDLGYDGSVAYLKANANFVKLDDWYSGKINGNGPGSPSEANSTYFSEGKYYSEVYVYVGDEKTIEISLHSHAFTWGGWLMFNNFKLTYYSDEVSDAEATTIIATADDLLAKEMDATIKSNLTNARNTFNAARTIANYNALNALISDAQASVDAYALFAPERVKALALGMTAETIAALAPDVKALKVAEYNFVNTNYKYGVALGTWTTTGETATNSGQHWDGTNTSTYLEQLNRGGDNPAGWNAQSWEVGYSQNVELPSGNYVFKVAGRRSSNDVVLSLVVKNGNTELGTVTDFPMGDTGKGIDTSGATNFGDGTYANNGTGRGFEWRYVKFTLSEPATVNVAVSAKATAQYQWMSFCNPTVQTDDEGNVDLMTALVALNDAKAAATLTKNTTNVGTGVFQLDATTNNNCWSAYEDAKTAAEGYLFTSSSTADEVNALANDLNTAIDNYKNQAPNAPEVDNHYYVKVATTGHSKLGNAIVLDRVAEYPVKSNNYVTNNTGFTLNASAAPNANLAQAVTFTHVSGNVYNISMQRSEGTVYLTYGSLNDSQVNWKNDQIQATTDADKKGEFRIVATATENVFNIVNTNTNNLIGVEDGGNIYTTNNNADFTLAEATKASIAINTSAAGYGTTILPFAAVIPTDVKAYTCEAYEGELLTLVEATAIEANKPYIIEGAWNETKEGWGSGAALENKVGLLTGVYAETDAPVGSYVMQKHDTKVGFFKVVDDKQPKVGANHCYVTASASTARAFFFSTEATGIKAIESLTSGEAQIFNTNGAQLPALQKGINIIRKSNGESYKVMVK